MKKPQAAIILGSHHYGPNTMKSDPVVILSARRTPVGAFQGAFATVTAPQLGAVAIKAAVADAGVKASEIDEVIMGCVLSAGIGQAPARQAALAAGLPASTPRRVRVEPRQP